MSPSVSAPSSSQQQGGDERSDGVATSDINATGASDSAATTAATTATPSPPSLTTTTTAAASKKSATVEDGATNTADKTRSLIQEPATNRTSTMMMATTMTKATLLERLQAGAFQSLCRHLVERSDAVSNMDLMIHGGFCRNCLAKVRA
jgi:hypothetical protein